MFKLVLFMLTRYLRFDKSQPFISITGILAFLGVGVGVMVLLVAMSIMNGMSKEFKKRLFVMNYPITIFSTSSYKIDPSFLQFLESRFNDLAFSPYIKTQSLIRYGDDIFPILLYGVDIDREKRVNEVVAKHHDPLDKSNIYSLMIGENLANNLLLSKDDRVTLIFTNLTPTGVSLIPRMKKFSISSTFSSGLNSYDNAIAYTTLSALSNINMQEGLRYDGIHVFSNDPFKDIAKVKEALSEFYEGQPLAKAQGWWEQNGNFFSAMELEKKALFIVLMLIILMASLNIISSLLMVVMNRRKEIALLITLGASKKEIKNIFLSLGLCIGGGGIVFGVISAFIVMEILKVFPIIKLPADVYGISTLPIDLLMSDFIFTLIGSVIIVFLSSFYPAQRASKIDSLSVLRNE